MIEELILFRIECDLCETQSESEQLLEGVTKPDLISFEQRARDEFKNEGWDVFRTDGVDICPECAKDHKEDRNEGKP